MCIFQRNFAEIPIYDHLFYGKYPAITINWFGKGSLVYDGCKPSDALQEKILLSAMERAGIKSADLSIHFPLIAKQGINDFCKKVHFYYNYSGSMKMIIYPSGNGSELTETRR